MLELTKLGLGWYINYIWYEYVLSLGLSLGLGWIFYLGHVFYILYIILFVWYNTIFDGTHVYTVHCTYVYTVHCTMYSVLCTLFTLNSTVYSVQCTHVYSVISTYMYSIWSLYARYALYSVQWWIMYTVHCTLYIHHLLYVHGQWIPSNAVGYRLVYFIRLTRSLDYGEIEYYIISVQPEWVLL